MRYALSRSDDERSGSGARNAKDRDRKAGSVRRLQNQPYGFGPLVARENNRTTLSKEKKNMLWTIFVILLVLWFVGLVTSYTLGAVSYTHLRAHETARNLVCRLLL